MALTFPKAIETTPPLADELLVERVRRGDEPAFEEIYARYLPRVYRFLAGRLRNRADTEEAVQQVFLNVFSAIGSFRGDAPFGAWIFGITRRTLANRFKKKRIRTVPLDEVAGEQRIARPLTGAGPSPHELYEYRERVVRLERAMARDLSGEQRLLFELHHIEQRSIREICRRLSKTENAVKSHLYRARKVLLAG